MSAETSLGHCEIRAWTSLRIDRLRARDSSDLRPWLQRNYRAVTKSPTADRYWTEDGGSKKLIKVAILSLTVWGSGLTTVNFQALCVPNWLVRTTSRCSKLGVLNATTARTHTTEAHCAEAGRNISSAIDCTQSSPSASESGQAGSANRDIPRQRGLIQSICVHSACILRISKAVGDEKASQSVPCHSGTAHVAARRTMPRRTALGDRFYGNTIHPMISGLCSPD